MWEIRTEINLSPYVKHGFHYTVFHDSQNSPIALLEDFIQIG
jgi:hypothetical protein